MSQKVLCICIYISSAKCITEGIFLSWYEVICSVAIVVVSLLSPFEEYISL